MKEHQCSLCGQPTFRKFLCVHCTENKIELHRHSYLAEKNEEFKLLKRVLREQLDEITYNKLMNEYNHQLQTLRTTLMEKQFRPIWRKQKRQMTDVE